jgi:hypothetical protein
VVARDIRLLKEPDAEVPWLLTVNVTEMLWPTVAEDGEKLTDVTVRSGVEEAPTIRVGKINDEPSIRIIKIISIALIVNRPILMDFLPTSDITIL